MAPIGKTVAQSTYFHLDALDGIEPERKQLIMTAAAIANAQAGRDFNVVKIASGAPTVSLLDYPAFFDEAFPVLRRYWTVSLETQTRRYRTYDQSLNPPILHRKELLLPEEHSQWEVFSSLTAAAEEIGLFDDTTRIGFKRAWETLLAQKGYRVVGHELVPIGNDESEVAANTDSDDFDGVARHLTALTRYGFSAPIQSLACFGFLDGSKTVFDYGCGRGDDLRGLKENGITTAGWDPYFAAEQEKRTAHIVNLGFVINVIEDPEERMQALLGAYGLTEELLVVSAMLANPEAVRGTPYADGVLTARNTFQKYYTQGELGAYLAEVLDEEPMPVGPGIYYVFKDKDAEQRFLVGRQTNRRNILRLARLSRPDRPARRNKAEEKYQQHREMLEALWEMCLTLGRDPDRSEIPSIGTPQESALSSTSLEKPKTVGWAEERSPTKSKASSPHSAAATDAHSTRRADRGSSDKTPLSSAPQNPQTVGWAEERSPTKAQSTDHHVSTPISTREIPPGECGEEAVSKQKLPLPPGEGRGEGASNKLPLSLHALTAAFGSLPAALRFIKSRKENAEDLLEQARQSRMDDLRVYFAQLQFGRRKPYRHLETRLQKDVKAFFGDYREALDAGKELLYAAANPEAIDAACREAAERGVGWLEEGESLTLPTELVVQLPAILRVYVNCGLKLYGDAESADLIKIHIHSGKLTLMSFDDFEGKPLPRMLQRVKIKLREQDLDLFEYGELYEPPYLYRKSRFINEEFPNYAEQVAFDEAVESLNLFDLSGYGPAPDAFDTNLEEARWAVDEFRLRRSTTIPDIDAPCGRYFTYRDLIECGETQARTGISNLPKEPDSYNALCDLATHILNPVIDYFGMIKLTYGFCSPALAKQIKGRIAPGLDQHACHERNTKGRPICSRLGAAVDFLVEYEDMAEVAQWIIATLPFDRLYFYGPDRPLHVSYSPEPEGAAYEMRTFGARRVPRRMQASIS